MPPMLFVRRKPSVFLVLGLVGIAAAFLGFFKTFFVPLALGKFAAPWGIYVHALFAFAWVIFFMIQVVLVHSRKLTYHRSLGYAGVFIACGAAVTLVPAGVYQVEKELAQGLGDTAFSAFLGIFTSGILFLMLVFSGIYFRRRPEVHKWFMLFATIVLLWPAWFRFRHYFPGVPDPHIWFGLVLADSLIVVALVWDYFRNRKLNKAFLVVGTLIVFEQTLEVAMFDTLPWRAVAKTLYTAVQW